MALGASHHLPTEPQSHPIETRTSPEPQALAKVPDIHPSPHLAALCPGSPRGLLSTLMGSAGPKVQPFY